MRIKYYRLVSNKTSNDSITSRPFVTLPNTTWRPLSLLQSSAKVIKNWDPFVSGPLLAIESKPFSKKGFQGYWLAGQ